MIRDFLLSPSAGAVTRMSLEIIRTTGQKFHFRESQKETVQNSKTQNERFDKNIEE